MKSPLPQHGVNWLTALMVFLGLGLYVSLLEWIDFTSLPWQRSLNDESAYAVANTLARTSVTLISSVLASLFLAVPLTANMYTPQLIELFVRSRTNQAVLGVYVLSATHAVWCASMVGGEEIPYIALAISQVLVLATLALLIPYLFSVFRFLKPQTIIAMVAKRFEDAVDPGRPWAAGLDSPRCASTSWATSS